MPTDPSHPATPGPVINSRLVNVRVLLAEDNVTNQIVAVKMLRRLGCEVEVVSNGFEVLASLERSSFDVVLMDVQMPKMDGYQATEAIRRREQGQSPPRRLPIIAMTANAMRGDRERCLAAEMDDYLSKPVTILELADAIERWVVRPGPEPSGAPAAPDRPGEPPEGPPVLRVARLRELSQGDAEFERELLEVLIHDVSNEMTRLQAALDPLDPLVVSTALHGIVGVCRTVGADALGLICRDSENQAKQPGFHPDASWLTPIKRERDRLVAAVDAYLHH